MKKTTSILIIFIKLGIIVITIVFGIMLYQEFGKIRVLEEPEAFVSNTVVSEKENQNSIKTPQIVDNNFSGIKGNEQNNETINYDNINVNKYFYSQLKEQSKTIYKAFESNKEAMKTGTAKIDLGDGFTEVLASQNGQEQLGNYYQSAIEAYIYDNPDIFYLNPSKMYLNIETTTIGNNVKYNLYINSGQDSNYLVDEFNSKNEVDNAILEVEQVKKSLVQKKTGNINNDIKMVHDYLVDTIEYDETISKENIYNIYGALINKVSVCEGYAESLKYILDAMEIPCIIVIGEANSQGKTESHAWNYVKTDKWYAIDTTWDDPVVEGGGQATSSSKTRYYMKDIGEFNKDHFPKGQFTEGGKVFSYPEN